MENLIGFRSLVRREIIRFTSVFMQTILPPVVSSFLFIFIFGLFVGRGLSQIHGMTYLQYLIPGLMMMYLVEGSYLNTSTSLFVSRWAGHIQEILITPLSYFEMVGAMVIGGLARSLVEAFCVYLVSLFFVRMPIAHLFVVFYFAIFVSLSFSCFGLIVGLLAEEFEHLSISTTFIVTPLIYMGGVFHSMSMIPVYLQNVMYWNPIFYMTNGMRYGMLGVSDASPTVSMLVVFVLFIILFSVVVYLFKTGYKLRK